MKRKKIDSFTLFVILLLALILTLLGMLLAGMKEEKRQFTVLLLTNFGIRISLNGIPFLLQELNYRRDSYIQISCNFV